MITEPSEGPSRSSAPAKVPLAPGLFSISTVLPKRSLSFSAMIRAITSVPPPGG